MNFNNDQQTFNITTLFLPVQCKLSCSDSSQSHLSGVSLKRVSPPCYRVCYEFGHVWSVLLVNLATGEFMTEMICHNL